MPLFRRLGETRVVPREVVLREKAIGRIHAGDLIRNSLGFVSWKDSKAIIPDLKAVYRAETADVAVGELKEFEAKWRKHYPALGAAWRRA